MHEEPKDEELGLGLRRDDEALGATVRRVGNEYDNAHPRDQTNKTFV